MISCSRSCSAMPGAVAMAVGWAGWGRGSVLGLGGVVHCFRFLIYDRVSGFELVRGR